MADIKTLLGDWSAGAIKTGVMDMAVWIIWGLVIMGVGIFAWKKYQDKKVFMYPVRIFRQRRNGTVKETNTFGGYIKKDRLTRFVVKISKFKKKDMDKLPLSEYMDEDNRVYYWQISPESPYIQTRRDFHIETLYSNNEHYVEPTQAEINDMVQNKIIELKAIDEYKDLPQESLTEVATRRIFEDIQSKKYEKIDITVPTYTPVSTDLKQQAMNDIAGYRNVLGVDVNKQFAYFIMGVIALIILGIVVFYIAVNKGALPILEFAPLLFFRRKKFK